MNILALDTSSQAASCALHVKGKLVGEYFLNAGLTHSQTVMPMVESLLKMSGFVLGDIDLFAVSTGPGSFTGLRIGIAAVKGMAMALDKPCAGVSTLEGLAENVRLFGGLIVPVLDARRDQVYTALFDGEETLSRLEGDEALTIPQLGERLNRYPDKPKLLVGDGAALCLEKLGNIVPGLSKAPENLLYQRAGSVCAVAARLGPEEAVSPGELVPSYLRLPQAERELLRKQSNPGGNTI